MQGSIFLLLVIGCAMGSPYRSRRSLEAEAFSARTGVSLDESQAIINWTVESKKTNDAKQLRNELQAMCKVIVANKEVVEQATVAGDLDDIGNLSEKDNKQSAIWKGFSAADDLGKITRIRRVCNIELH